MPLPIGIAISGRARAKVVWWLVARAARKASLMLFFTSLICQGRQLKVDEIAKL